MPILLLYFLGFGYLFFSDPIRLELVSSFEVEEGYAYNLIHVSEDRILYQEFYMKEIIRTSFDGVRGDTLKIPVGRGPGEYTGGSSPIKANADYLFVLDRRLAKILKYTASDFQYVHETLVPPGTWEFAVGERVYARTSMTEKFYHEIDFTRHRFSGLGGAIWPERFDRLHHLFTFEGFDLASMTTLFLVKYYDPVYYKYNLTTHELRKIRYENNPAVDFTNTDFMGSLRLHIRNAVLFGSGEILGVQGYGRGGGGRSYTTNTIHFFESMTGHYLGEVQLPGVDIGIMRLVANEEYLVIHDSNSNRIYTYRYYVNSR